MPTARIVLAVPALVTALGGGLAACGSGKGAQPGARTPAIAFARLPDHANQLLGGGPAAFRRQLAALRGHPVVVNQWASWCGPCRFEFPFFASVARRYRGRVAFLGVDSQDNSGDARDFLRRLPVPYPSFEDQDADVAREFRGGIAWPTTAFYDARGKRTKTHAGAYATEAKLDGDVRSFALR